MKIDRIKRDPKDEPKYKFEIFEILIFIILVGGFIGFLIVKDKKEEFKVNNKNQIKIIDDESKGLDDFIEKSEAELIVES